MAYIYTKPRVPVAATYSGPGPCYSLPSLVGQEGHDPRNIHSRAPAFPFGIRHRGFFQNLGPGPQYFPDVRLRRTGIHNPPAYTMAGRKSAAEGRERKMPGPMDYEYERSMNQVSGQIRPPAYSFGMNLRQRKTDCSPGPAAYDRPRLLGSSHGPVESHMKRSSSANIVGRRQVGSFDKDLSKSPGPGAYGQTSLCVYCLSIPAYSMSTRNFVPHDATTKPGPGAYDSHKTWITRKESPKFSFGIRHSNYITPLIVKVTD